MWHLNGRGLKQLLGSWTTLQQPCEGTTRRTNLGQHFHQTMELTSLFWSYVPDRPCFSYVHIQTWTCVHFRGGPANSVMFCNAASDCSITKTGASQSRNYCELKNLWLVCLPDIQTVIHNKINKHLTPSVLHPRAPRQRMLTSLFWC